MARTLEEAVQASLIEGKLHCEVAFEIAEELGVARIEVGDMANKLGIKLSGCQLGCFP